MARLLSIFSVVMLTLLMAGGAHARANDGFLIAQYADGGANPALFGQDVDYQTVAESNQDVVILIRTASDRTGVDFQYLLAQAQLESSLNPQARARGSSATGLFQFIETTWLSSLRKHAPELGIEQILLANDSNARPLELWTREELLRLREDPLVSALIAAAYAKDNGDRLREVLGRQADSNELYLAHFLGTGGAARFLRLWQADPAAGAASYFPRAARANRSIFYTAGGHQRSLDEVLLHIGRKLERALRDTLTLSRTEFEADDTQSSNTFYTYFEGLGGSSEETFHEKNGQALTVNMRSMGDLLTSEVGNQSQISSIRQSCSTLVNSESQISVLYHMISSDYFDSLEIRGASGRQIDPMPAQQGVMVAQNHAGQRAISTCNHIAMCYTIGMSTSTITRVRTLVESGEMTKAGLARAAGLHANTLRDASEPDWNPTAETLSKLEMFLDSNDERPVLVGIEEIIDEARNGKMYILVDDEDRENEGDLIIPAQMATPAAINFMATHGRGLICLALDKARVDQLGLEPMSRNNKESMQTAFTISIEAKEGVTTGISAADRARTVSVAIDATKGADDIVTPGHVFPLTARDGGTLVRAGHTEAAVDISRLAGLNPSGVICEIMNEDGSMARLDDLVAFARKHDLKIGTIRDLIAYRMRNDHLVERLGERSFESDYGGQWRLITYRDRVADSEAYVLQKGHVNPGEPTLARVHPISVFDDVLGAPGPRKRTLQRAMGAIGEHGSGVIVILTQRVGSSGEWTQDEEIRNIGIGSQILADLGVHEMVLLSNSRPDLVALDGYGITITDHQPIPE